MGVFVLEGGGAAPLRSVAPRLSPGAQQAFAGASVEQVRVDTVNKTWFVSLPTEAPVPKHFIEEFEQGLLQIVPNLSRVFVEAGPGASDRGSTPAQYDGDRGAGQDASGGEPASGAGPAQCPAGGTQDAGRPGAVPPGEPPSESPDDVYGMNDDDYLQYVLERAANGPPLVPTSGHDGGMGG